MNEKRLLARVRAAVQRYDMIGPGQTVAVGLSGGKDSVVLLWLLARLRRFYPVPFSLAAVTLDPCFGGEPCDYEPITRLCERLEVPHRIERVGLWDIVAAQGAQAHPCGLCARLRRGILHRIAAENGWRTVALGHHQNDAAETFMMNLLSGAAIGSFAPKSWLDRRGITVIRPMVFIAESEIAAFAARAALPVVKSRCPVDGATGRQQMKNLLAELAGDYGDVCGKITAALQKDHIQWKEGCL